MTEAPARLAGGSASMDFNVTSVSLRRPRPQLRAGSISKLFTWTPVMQLSEQGKLDLGKDVNEYMDFKIPPAYGKPVTLKNIMTHTAGLEELVRDLFVADAQHMHSLEQFLKNGGGENPTLAVRSEYLRLQRPEA